MTSENRHAHIEKMVREWLNVSRDRTSAYMNDAMFHCQCAQFRRMLHLVDEALKDSGIVLRTRDKVLRTVLYGGPDEAEALRRMDEFAKQVKLLEQQPFTGKGFLVVE